MTKMMPTPRSLSWRIMPKSLSTSDSSSDEVGSSRMRTLQSMSTARAMATICCMAIEQLPSCCLALTGMPRFCRILSASVYICFQLATLEWPRPMYMFSATVRLGQSVISWYTVAMPTSCASCGDLMETAPSWPWR